MRVALFFGFFQGGFAGMGWLLSNFFKQMIEHIDHWIAFLLLLGIGGKMIIESVKPNHPVKTFNVENYLILLGLSVATSIDALIVGMGLGFLEMPVLSSVLIITMITCLFSFTGFILGSKNGFHLLGRRAELIGGLILAGIGIKVLVEHLAG